MTAQRISHGVQLRWQAGVERYAVWLMATWSLSLERDG